MQKIAIITQRIFPFYNGGSERALSYYASELSKKYSVTVFTSLNKWQIFKKAGNPKYFTVIPKVDSINKNGNHSLLWIFLFSVFITRYMKKISNFDLVILDSIHYFYPKIFLSYLKNNNKKVVTIFHEAWYEYRKSSSFSVILSFEMSLLIRRLIEYSNVIFSNSDSTTKSLINNYNVNSNNIFTIPLSIDFKYIHKNFYIKKIEERDYEIVFLGRFAKIKRINDLINALFIIKQKRKNVRMAIVGEGPLEIAIRNQIDSLALKENVTLFGYLDDVKKFNILNNSKIFALPSEREGFSIATLEAMAIGCVPVVSKPLYNEIFGVSHFVKHEVNGLYYEVGNVTSLANSILFLLDNPEQLYEMSAKAIETAKSLDKDVMEKKIIQAVEMILS